LEEVGWLGTAYGMTVPVPFEPAPASAHFEERLGGLEVREFDNEKLTRR
jgi:hypothetical protein